MARYITVHDDRIPYPIKDFTIPIEGDKNYVHTVEQVCETLYRIDDMLEDVASAKKTLYGEENS